MTKDRQFAALFQELADASAEARRLWDELPPELRHRRARPNQWSVAENLEHLSLTTEQYLPRLDPEQVPSGSGPYQLDFWGRVLRWVLNSRRMKVKTAAPFEPVAVEPVEQVLDRFLSLQEQLLERMEQFDGRAIDRVKITSPFAGGVRYSVYSAFVLISAHQRRHLRQAAEAAVRQ